MIEDTADFKHAIMQPSEREFGIKIILPETFTAFYLSSAKIAIMH